MEAYVVDWLGLLVRWLHLVAGVAWIGASFHFVRLDNALSPPAKAQDKQRGVHGELWAVHGGGFYLSQKFLTGPKGEPLAANLHWSKWEAYTTWLSGVGLLALVYWHGASTYLIDRSVLALTPLAGIGLSIAFLTGGWFAYDLVCRTLAGRDRLLAAVVLALVLAASWALFQVFSARAAYVHVGAMLGTMMVANVFFHIIPGQRQMVSAIRAGHEPDPKPGVVGKQRSVHNTYFTLPVLFTMISGHYPMTYGHPWGWAVLGVIMLAGVLIRQYFVLRHKGELRPALPAIALVLLVVLAVLVAPDRTIDARSEVAFAQVRAVLDERCAGCHATHPTHAGFAQPPKGVVLETPEQIVQHAAKIAETVANRTMPIGNLTQMTNDERSLIAAWYAQGTKR